MSFSVILYSITGAVRWLDERAGLSRAGGCQGFGDQGLGLSRVRRSGGRA